MLDEKSLASRMEKSIEVLKKDLAKVRTGMATPSMLDNIKVDYYGTPTAISHVSSITIPESRTLSIQPFEKKMLGVIEKAILASDLGITPSSDGQVIRLNLPILTTERRQELTKRIKSIGEEARVSVRNIRRDENESIKKQAKDAKQSEDQVKQFHDKVQQITDKYIAQIDVVVSAKEKDIMHV